MDSALGACCSTGTSPLALRGLLHPSRPRPIGRGRDVLEPKVKIQPRFPSQAVSSLQYEQIYGIVSLLRYLVEFDPFTHEMLYQRWGGNLPGEAFPSFVQVPLGLNLTLFASHWSRQLPE
jgi:hypothetical protein